MRPLICLLIALGIGFAVVQDAHQRGMSTCWGLAIFLGVFGVILGLFLTMYLLARKSSLPKPDTDSSQYRIGG